MEARTTVKGAGEEEGGGVGRGVSSSAAHVCGPAGRTAKENRRPISGRGHFLCLFYQMREAQRLNGPLTSPSPISINPRWV